MRKLILALSISLTLIFSVTFADNQQSDNQANVMAGQKSETAKEAKLDSESALTEPKTITETQKKNLIKMQLLMKIMANDS